MGNYVLKRIRVQIANTGLPEMMRKIMRKLHFKKESVSKLYTQARQK